MKAQGIDKTRASGGAFDYGLLGPGARRIVERKTSEIRDYMKQAAANVIEIGKRLIVAKGQLGHGHFLAWLSAEFDWSESTAQKMMSVARTFKSVKFTDLRIGPSALYLLASDVTPQEVRDRFIEDAKGGKRVTHSEVRKAVKPEVVTKAEYEGEIVDDETGEVVEEKSRRPATSRQLDEKRKGAQARALLARERQMSASFRQAFNVFRDAIVGCRHEGFAGDTTLEAARACIRHLHGLVESPT